MKKTLLAVAVAAALPAAAFAQSSVTLYGVADIAISKATGGDANMSSNGGGNNGTSRLGVRGTEDLGGGLKVSFNFEQAVNLETGATDDTVTTQGVAVPSSTWQRAAWVSLGGKFGDVRFGRSLTPSFYGVAAWELTGTANYSVTYGAFGAAGGTTRSNSTFAYTTPNMGGFTATIGYITDVDNGLANGERLDANLIYRQGPMVVSAWYNKNDTASDPGWGVGGKYNFGSFVVAGGFQEKPNQDDGFSLGVGTKLGPVDLVLDFVRYTVAATDVSYNNFLVEAKYPLSKRTFLYGTYLNMDRVADMRQTSIGIRHNF